MGGASHMPKKVLTIFGTRPEAIKLAPVIHELETQPATFQTVNVTSGQHRDLLDPFVRLFNLRIDHDLKVMQPNQTPNAVCARVLTSLDPILDEMCAAGLTGMEVYYHGYAGDLADYLKSVCQDRSLIPCGGSDFHGIDGKTEAGLGRIDVPMTTAERLYAAAGKPMP